MNGGLTTADMAWPSTTIDLDGTWELVIGEHSVEELSSTPGQEIDVPGLWEAQGYLELDGTAWCRRLFEVADVGGWWTLHFGAVMDDADVFVNGHHVGSHRGGFTPFALDCTGVLRSSTNEIAVRIVDHPRGSPEHSRGAHGKQGWMNEVFPSPPSLYLDYGGIWQPVSLEQHGPVRVADCWANGHPDALVVEASLVGVSDHPVTVQLAVLGRVMSREVEGTDTEVRFAVGAAGAAELWSPAQPTLHEAVVTVFADGCISDERRLRFGLRTVRVTPSSFELNGVPFEMRSALVQGFSARTLYGAATRAEAEADIAAARSLGLNTVRLHIKAFDPIYLDVCDELGMLVHCDIPIAEPIAHDELGWDGELTERCVSAAVEQVCRDRSHPSIVLWSAMNELGAEQLSVRPGPGYEGFVRRLYREIRSADPTRPVVENDWVEPGPDYVFESPILTAHWYGRISQRYMAELETKVKLSASGERPLFLSEFGDWGLPDLSSDGGAFWSYRDGLSQLIESTPWPTGVADFVAGSQRYQGLADRLQVELFRRTPGVIGWCVTELTDVPQEFNGLLDLLRRAKQPACDEVRLAAQRICPLLVRSHWSVAVGGTLVGDLVVVNDGPAVEGAEARAWVGDRQWSTQLDLPAYAASTPRAVSVPIDRAGDLQLNLELWHGNEHLGHNYYPVRAVQRLRSAVPISVAGPAAPSLERLLVGSGSGLADGSTAKASRDLLVVPEGSLSAELGHLVYRWLVAGGNALLLAQRDSGDLPLPIELRLVDLATAWGSTPFIFTTSQTVLSSLPGRSVLATELLSVAPEFVFTHFGSGPFAADTVVGVLKPPPDQIVGTVVGRAPVMAGWLTACQLPLTEQAIAGDPLCVALLSDLLRWAAVGNNERQS